MANDQCEQTNGAPTPTKVARVIFEFDPATCAERFVFEGNYPIPFLVNQLEICKSTLIQRQLAMMMQQAQEAAQQGLVLPDGSLAKPHSGR